MANKVLKWGASAARVVACKMANRGRLEVHAGKPLYLAGGARIEVAPGGRCVIGQGVYLSRGCLLQVNAGAQMHVADDVFFNENTRVVAWENVRIGRGTLFGPNVSVYDHDHMFDGGGVHAGLVSAPVSIGSRCWIAANSLVTKGVEIADAVLVGGGSVVTRPLLEPGIYAGVPARLIGGVGVGDGDT